MRKPWGKKIAIRMPKPFYFKGWLNSDRPPSSEHWFIQRACGWDVTEKSPRDTLYETLDTYGWFWLKEVYDSPLEQLFAEAWVGTESHKYWKLTYQHPIKDGAYRLDFAYEPARLGIELDGYSYHSGRDAFTRDRQRQRDIESLGWHIIRFSGDELRNDITSCINDVRKRLRQRSSTT